MTSHYPDLGSTSDWLKQISRVAEPIRRTTEIWVVTRHQYGISALVSHTSFRGETSGDVATCRLFSQANVCSNSSKYLETETGYMFSAPFVNLNLRERGALSTKKS